MIFSIFGDLGDVYKMDAQISYDSPNIAEMIKVRSKSKGIAIKDMLESLQLGSNTMSHMRHGRAIASDSLARIADYLDCSVDYLLGRTDNPERRIFLMLDSLNIDFDKISSEVQNYIYSANKAIIAENPEANINEIDRVAAIAKAVCLSALQAYHDELSKTLQPRGTTVE